jgi:hypothetical protein
MDSFIWPETEMAKCWLPLPDDKDLMILLRLSESKWQTVLHLLGTYSGPSVAPPVTILHDSVWHGATCSISETTGTVECGIFSSRIMQHISPMWCTELTARLRFGNAGTSFLFLRPLSMWLHCFAGRRSHFRNASLCLHMPSTRLLQYHYITWWRVIPRYDWLSALLVREICWPWR